jgi:hypothetical protein
MRPFLRLIALLAGCFGPPLLAKAQTPSLEFSSGAGNPTSNGPATANQVITFQTNANNPTDNVFTASTVTATFALSNQIYALPTTKIATGAGVSFGGNVNGTGQLAGGLALFPRLNLIGNANNANSNTNYSSVATTIGTGIDIATNNGVEVFASTEALPVPAVADNRYQYADLTITFSQAIANPVINIAGLGGTYNNGVTSFGFTSEFDLQTPGLTLSRLSGSQELTVNPTQILNTANTLGSATGSGAASGSILVTTPAAGITSLVLRIFVRPETTTTHSTDNTSHSGDGFIIGISSRATVPIAGYVYEDVNYGGGAGRPFSASGTVGRPNARVELYNAAGAFVQATTTDANGLYSFSPAVGTYTVRVVNSSVTSSRTGAVASLVPVQTYNGTTTRVGGEAPEKVDAGNGTTGTTLTTLTTGATAPQSIASVTLGATAGTTSTGVDFGYNFDTVVNTNDAGQGSLRQFITNANALGDEASLAQSGSYTNQQDLASNSTAAGRAPVALPIGTETSIFMIPSARLTTGVAVITLSSTLPTLTGANTALNGATQTFNIGNTNDVLLGAGGTTGTNNTALSKLNGPEVQIVGNSNIAIGLNTSAVNTTLRGLAIYGFGNVNSGTLNTFDNDNNANIRSSANGLTVNQTIVGATATNFALPGTITNASNIRLAGGTSGIVVSNNLIGFANGKGIAVGNTTTNVLITNNEIRTNGLASAGLDGIDIQGSATSVTNNLLTGTSGQGVDSYFSTGANNIVGNTITDNGRGTSNIAPNETPGVRIYGANNTVSQNIISDNYGAGIMLQATGQGGTAVSATVMSANSIFNNGNVVARNGAAATGEVGIDLQTNNTNEAAGVSPYVTLNSATTTGANGLVNYPILRTATVVGTNLVVTGYAKSGAVIELFVSQPNPSAVNATGANFGQGKTFLTTLTEGASTGITDGDNSTFQSYSGNINGFAQGSDTNANGFTFVIPLSSLPNGAVTGGTVLTSTATRNGSTSEFSGNVTTIAALSGYVYEDVNYGGGAGRSRATLGAAAIGRPGAIVELYSGAGAYLGRSITDANGMYSFTQPVGTGYTVRVVNSSVLSSRAGATSTSGSAAAGFVSTQLAVQTYNGTTTRVGGENPALTDAAANTGSQAFSALISATNTPESIGTANVGTGATNAGPDFGFNFDVVVNTNPTGQGSLRQFIANSNALGGENLLAQSGSNNAGTLPTGTETSIFMIPSGAAVPGLLASTNGGPASQLNASGVAAINITAALPSIASPNTSIDGTTQTINIGNTNNLTLNMGGTVGTGSAITTLNQLNGPEVQLKGTQSIDGITAAANAITVRGLSIYGFDTGIVGGNDNTGLRVEQNVIGASATSFTDPTGTNRTLNEGVNLNGADFSIVTNNLIGFNGGMGVWVLAGANNNTISGNEIRSNALTTQVNNVGERLVFDGIELQGNSTGNTISGNLITATLGHGIDSFGNDIGGNRIIGNTISNNGVGVASGTGEEGSGLRIFGTTNPTIISNNVLTGNNGSGVLLMGTANQVTISQNVTSGNTRLGIDLLNSAETNYNSTTAGTIFWNGTTGTTPNVTLNDSGDGDTGGNGLLNFPVLTTANVTSTSLVINGFARPGSLVELFLATPLTTDITNSNRNFGQGSSYLVSRTEGNATDDADTGTGLYTGLINGVNQGTDNTNRFTFTIALSSLTPAQQTALLNGSAILTSTATLANSTSEFSANLPLPVTDVTTALAGPATLTPGQPSGNYTATFTNEGPVTATSVTRKVTLPTGVTNVVLPAGASLTGNVIDFDNGTPVTLASGATSSFTFSFTPATTATGSLAIASNVTTTTSQGINTAPDASTINATVAPTANVAATVTATTTSVAAGTLASAGTPPKFTVTFSNAGPATAAGVVASVQLPTGLTNVNATNNGVYNSTTGIVTYASLTSIASGTPTTSVITFDAPAAGPIVASATISTTTSEAGQTANNSQTASMSIVSAYDLVTFLSGPTSAVTGDLVTLIVTTTNNGPSAVANAVQTVQLASGLTNVYVSNGGVYNPATTTQTIVSNGVSYSVPAGGVVFPTLANLSNGQTVANSVSYAQPATVFAPSALVTPNTASTATTAGDTNTANNTAFLNGAASSTTLATAAAAAGTANAYTSIKSSVATTSVGAAVTLTVVTGNNGPAAATGAIQQVEVLPGFTTSTIQVNGATGTLNSNVITFGTGGPTYNTLTGVVTFPALANNVNGAISGTSVSNTITFNAPAATGSNGQLLATATVSTTNTDPVAADNVAAVAVTLLQTTDLTTSINGPTSATAGQAVTYTVSYLNNGPMTATGVTETAQLPAGLGTVTITDATGAAVSGTSYNNLTGLVTFPTQPTLASGVRQVYKLSFAAPAQSFSPSTSVASTSADGVAANNNATVSTSVAASADLATTVSGPATAVVGNPVTYSVITTNNGPVAASGTTATLQLAAGFSVATLRVNGQTGILNGTLINYANGDVYNTGNGLVTFATVTSLANGASVSNYATFIMPNAAGGQTTGMASASATGNVDPTDTNNTRSVATSVAPTTTNTADVTADVTTTAPASVAVGTAVIFTATYGNSGPNPALNVKPTLQLSPGFGIATLLVANQAGTLSGNIITFPNTATYNTTTGLLTFPTIASQASGTGADVSYSVQVTAPANGPLVATAATTTDTSEPNTTTAQNNDVKSASVNVTPLFDEVTSISGPASALPGTSQTYTVTTTNSGPSPTANTTTQTVTVPAGQTPTGITNGGVYSSLNNNITWTIAAGQTAGSNGAVANSFTIVLPAAGFTSTATVTVTGESNNGNNGANVTTTATNQPPLAYAVVNTRQSATGTTNNPMGSSVANNPATPTGLLISPLLASDPEGALNSTTPFTITAVPPTTQGVLYYDNGGTYTAVTAGKTLSATQATTLRFLPNTTFSGNATFTYLSTDAANNQSPTVNYSIPVAADQASVYVKYNAGKGGSNKYATNDILAQTTDANTAVYTSAGIVYDATTGVLQSGAANGLPTTGTNAVLSSGTLPTGVSLDPITGRIYVSNATLLPRITMATNYTVNVTTTDINGGTTTVPVTFTIGGYPLPVELKEFTAKAVNNLDAALAWSTASEKSNDHFDVERSFNGTDFVKIGQVLGQGSKSSATDYALTDAAVARKASGIVYYRLKQVDTDGTATFSPVRTVRFTAAGQMPTIALFPNPATSATQLDLSQLPAGTYQVQVLDATGRVVLSATQEAGISQALNLNTIASGTYTVRVSGQALNLTKRLIKE